MNSGHLGPACQQQHHWMNVYLHAWAIWRSFTHFQNYFTTQNVKKLTWTKKMEFSINRMNGSSVNKWIHIIALTSSFFSL